MTGVRYCSWWTSAEDRKTHVFDGEDCLHETIYVALCGHAVDRDRVDKATASWPCWACHRELRAGVPQQRLADEVHAATERRAILRASPRNTKTTRGAFA